MPDCFKSESPEREEFWVDPIIDSIGKFATKYLWQIYDDKTKRSSSSIPDIDSSSSVEDLFSGKYLPQGSESKDWIEMFTEQKKSKTMTTSIRYNRHAYTVKPAEQCPLDSFFIGKFYL